jgi:hypothetical protein
MRQPPMYVNTRGALSRLRGRLGRNPETLPASLWRDKYEAALSTERPPESGLVRPTVYYAPRCRPLRPRKRGNAPRVPTASYQPTCS